MNGFPRNSTARGLPGPVFFFVSVLVLTAVLGGCSFFKPAKEPGVQEGRGHEIVSIDCGRCHGGKLQGDGPQHSSHLPEPSNLTLVRNTRTMPLSIVRHGVPGTAMPPIPLPVSMVDSVLVFLSEQPVGTASLSMPRGIDKDTVPDRARGRALFAATCTGCHGGNADGNGPWGKDPRVRPSPANLHARSSAMGRLYFIISNGREGTMMAPQKDAFDEKAR